MKKTLLLCLTLLLGVLGAASAQSLSPLGVWTDGEKKAQFEIYKCGDKLCGKILSLTEPNDPKTGKPKLDAQNPDPKLRNRPLVGIVFMQSFEYEGENKWDDGKIYKPQNGKTYSCYIKMLKQNSMEVKGYIGFSLIGESQTWTRVR
ncbi:DUF2147 domain-containing protein [Hymenobacter wooponensis]|uniref:DUF2147 domain-containing protein n=1 Tax=Hymenobacter wooponensis TaxID=1525360 RepID=A0A4Z0MLW8_9BACT|nr:DUF2147 domain-containing protein [Hymenobacter wooponensis]TGD80476.1 DUF2147 domain-containing protein [Hymenobacter wooponensis]